MHGATSEVLEHFQDWQPLPDFACACRCLRVSEIQLPHLQVLEHFQDWQPLPEFAPHGIFWWNAQLLRYIVAPNARLEALVCMNM